MERVNGILCATRYELIDAGLISARYLKDLVDRKTLQIVVRGCRGRQAQYAVDSLPEKYRAEVYKRFDVPPMERKKTLLEQCIRPYPEAYAFFHAWRFEDGRALPEERAEQYINEATLLEAISRARMEHCSVRAKGGKSPVGMAEFVRWMVSDLSQMPADLYPNRLPLSSRLLDKYKTYKREGMESLIHKGYRNQNARKAGELEQDAYLRMLLMNQNSLQYRHIARLYNDVAEVRGWETVTAEAVRKFASKHRTAIEAGRKGATEFRLKEVTAIKRTKPTRALSYWVHDGWTVELYYQQTSTDKKGNTKTVYDCRLTVVVILDASCSYPIGYAIGEKESPALIAQALRNALHHTRELFGAIYHPREMQYDHYQSKKLEPLYAAMSEKLSPARVKNARAKLIEPYFSYLNREYCKLEANWSGYGVTSRKGGKGINTDVTGQRKGETPTRPEVEGQIHTIIARERAKKHDELLEKFDGDLTGIELSREVYLEHWGETSGRYIGQSIYGLSPTIYGEVCYYECFDRLFLDNKYQRWQVYYDPCDLSSVLAVSEDRLVKLLLERKHLQPMASEDQTEADREHLEKVRAFQRSIEDDLDREYQELLPIALEVAEASPTAKRLLSASRSPFRGGKQVKETPQRTIDDNEPIEEAPYQQEVYSMLPDSQGQVKNNRYEKKLQHELSHEEDAPKPKRRSILERV